MILPRGTLATTRNALLANGSGSAELSVRLVRTSIALSSLNSGRTSGTACRNASAASGPVPAAYWIR